MYQCFVWLDTLRVQLKCFFLFFSNLVHVHVGVVIAFILQHVVLCYCPLCCSLRYRAKMQDKQAERGREEIEREKQEELDRRTQGKDLTENHRLRVGVMCVNHTGLCNTATF